MSRAITIGNIRFYLAGCVCGVQGEYTSREAAEAHHPEHQEHK